MKQICTLVLFLPFLICWKFVLLHTLEFCCCIKHGDSSTTFFSSFIFPIPLSKHILWVCIFNLTFFFLIISFQIINVPMCFTNLHFTRNNWYCLKHFVACRFLFCSWMSLFRFRNSYRCYKLLIFMICTQIVVDGNAIFYLFME